MKLLKEDIDKKAVLRDLILKYKTKIDSHDYADLYIEAEHYKLEPNITALLLKSGNNPLDYLKVIPSYFAYKVDNDILKNINIKSDVEGIGGRAFSCCNSIEQVTFDTDRMGIGIAAFEGCENLKSIIFNKPCTNSIPRETFIGCKSLEEFKFNGNPNSSSLEINTYAFAGCGHIKKLEFNCETEFYDCVFYGCEIDELYLNGDTNWANSNTFKKCTIHKIYCNNSDSLRGSGFRKEYLGDKTEIIYK